MAGRNQKSLLVHFVNERCADATEVFVDHAMAIGLCGLGVYLDIALARTLGFWPATVVVDGLLAPLIVLGYRLDRKERGDRRYLRQIRRWWWAGTLSAGYVDHRERPPKLHVAEASPVGARLLVEVLPGSSVSEMQKRAETLAAALRVREIRVERHEEDAGLAWVTAVRRDPLAQDSDRWPLLGQYTYDLWHPIPVGVDENGEVVTVSLPERNVLIGGEPGAGKSVALSLLIAAAALSPNDKLWLFDGKMVELAAWSKVAERTVDVDIEQAIAVLRALHDEMTARYQQLLANRLRKVSRGTPLHLVVFDELAFYVTAPDRAQRTELIDLLRDLVSRGRAAGVIVIAATQKPASDVIPTSIRDLFGFRWALRCNTSQASDTILGSGWSSLGYDASRIPGAQRGVGYLLAEDGEPVRLRSFYLSDEDLDHLAGRAYANRQILGPARA